MPVFYHSVYANVVNSWINSHSPSTTLYAVWSPHVYTITLDQRNGSGGTEKIYEKYATDWYSNSGATSAITSITIPTRTANNGTYVFSGYYTKTGGNGTAIIKTTGEIRANTNKAFSSDTTLYAYWKILPGITFSDVHDASSESGGYVNVTCKATGGIESFSANDTNGSSTTDATQTIKAYLSDGENVSASCTSKAGSLTKKDSDSHTYKWSESSSCGVKSTTYTYSGSCRCYDERGIGSNKSCSSSAYSSGCSSYCKNNGYTSGEGSCSRKSNTTYKTCWH